MQRAHYLNTIENHLKVKNPLRKTDLVDDLSADKDIHQLSLLKYKQKISRDEKQNISSSLITIKEDGKNKLLFLRDARNINNEKIDESYNFAGIGLNYLIAAKRMLLVANKAHLANINFIQLADQLIAAIHAHSNPKTLAQFISNFLHEKVEPLLKEHLPHLNIRNSLEKWVLWSSLEMPTPAVATINSFTNKEKNETFVQLDIPQTQLTPEMKTEWEYPNLQKKNNDKKIWFDYGLDNEEKLIAKHYAPLMLKEDRTGPAQLRDKIPGLKNAYEQLTLQYNENGNQSLFSKKRSLFSTLNQMYHSSTVVYVPKINNIHNLDPREIENEKLRLAKLALKQQRYNADNLFIHYFTLNSKESDSILRSIDKVKKLGQSDYYGVDSDVVTFSQQAAHEMARKNNKSGIYVSNFCLNEYRIIFSDDRPGILELESHIRKFNQCLDNWKSRHKIRTTFETRKYKELDAYIKLFQADYNRYFGFSGKGTREEHLKAHFFRKIDRLNDLLDKEVANLKEVTLINSLIHLKNLILEVNQELNAFSYPQGKTALYVGCASGDNRTGILLTHAAAKSMGLLGNVEHLRRFTRAGHTQEMSGGSICTCGIREQSKGAFPDSYDNEVIANLIGYAADVKKLPPPKKIKIKENLETMKIRLLAKLNATAHTSIFQQKDIFAELKNTIKKHLIPDSQFPLDRKWNSSLQPSKKYLKAIVNYYLELKNKDAMYERNLRKLNVRPIIRPNKDDQDKIKNIADRNDLKILAGNFNTVLNVLNKNVPLKEKRATLEKFKKTIPEESRTIKFLTFVSLAFSVLCPPLHVFLVYKFNAQERAKKARNNIITGNFANITQQLDAECHRQENKKNYH